MQDPKNNAPGQEAHLNDPDPSQCHSQGHSQCRSQGHPQDGRGTGRQALRIYVAGPYTGSTREDVEANVSRAIDAGIELFRRGHQPYVPHLTDIVDRRARETGREMTWEDFMAWDAPWLRACDALLLLAESRGALIELREAQQLGKTIFRSLDEVPENRGEGRG